MPVSFVKRGSDSFSGVVERINEALDVKNAKGPMQMSDVSDSQVKAQIIEC